MEKLATAVIDFNDDSSGDIFRDIFPTVESIPEIIKTASREEPKDHEYAVVMVNDGIKFPKYAMHDAGNTVLSVIYLIKQAELLPNEVVKVAAENLINASGRFKLPIPEELKELASNLSSKGIEVRTRDKSWRPVDTLKQVDDLEAGREVKTASLRAGLKTVGENALRGGAIGAGAGALNSLINDGDIVRGAGRGAIAGSISGTLGGALWGGKPGIGTALFGYRAADKPYERRKRNTVDVTNKEPEPKTVEKKAQYLLLGEYPVDTYDQVKMAQEYFLENWREFEPVQRREYCSKLASRMEDISMQVPQPISQYASESYGADVDRYVSARKDYVAEDLHPVLDSLLNKKAHVNPDTFAEALQEFDKIAGLDRFWDSRLHDPYRSTFGVSLTKIANDDWVFTDLGLHIDESDLVRLSRKKISLVRDQFGEDFAERFIKHPKRAFDTLDKDTKVICARLATTDH